jgi:hypothetical protein
MPDKLPQHPFVESVKSDPSGPAKKIVILTGLPGDSDRSDCQRLYLTTKLDYYAEFPVSAILSAETVPADQSPVPGQEATRVAVSRDATIRYVTETSPQPIDEFDLDVRLGAAGRAAAVPNVLSVVDVCIPTRGATCIQDGCPTDATCHVTECHQHTCQTCAGHATCAGAATCAGPATCVNTQCQQATCVNTQCGQHTCVNTQCGQHTCANTCAGHATCLGHTCHTCVTCVAHTCNC